MVAPFSRGFQVMPNETKIRGWGPLASMIMRNRGKSEVRKRIIQIVATLILVLSLWGHISEIFDHWDNTLQTGNDIEYSTVIVVLVAGAAIAVACAAARVARNSALASCPLPVFSSHTRATFRAADFIGHSPPRPLRI